MDWNSFFILNSIGFGIGLAMDAFSASLANGMNEPDMRRTRACAIAGNFALFQTLMPLIGWFCVHHLANAFSAFQKFIPWIALGLLLFIGGSMLREGFHYKEVKEEKLAASCCALMVQGIATSIDALSVGFTIADYSWQMALAEALIIGAVTFAVCLAGLYLGRRIGTRLAGKASILGGGILIAIGLEIFLTGIF